MIEKQKKEEIREFLSKNIQIYFFTEGIYLTIENWYLKCRIEGFKIKRQLTIPRERRKFPKGLNACSSNALTIDELLPWIDLVSLPLFLLSLLRFRIFLPCSIFHSNTLCPIVARYFKPQQNTQTHTHQHSQYFFTYLFA